MGKPTNLKDLLREGHITLSEVRKIAKDIFDGTTTAAGPEGYVVTASNFDDLPDHVQGFIVKGILEFSVENVLDSHDKRTDLERSADEEAEAARAETGLEKGDFGDE
jgi:hypothetical protein